MATGNNKRKSILAWHGRKLSGLDVRGARDAAEISQADLAEVLGISRRSMIRVEQEELIPKLVTAALYGIGLFEDTKEKANEHQDNHSNTKRRP